MNIIIPTLGRPSLKQSLQSLVNQTIDNWHAYVIFDGVKIDNDLIIQHENIHYFEIESELKWYAFEKAIMDIKYNTDDNNFDAALATFYRVDGLIDLVRIYKKDISLNELKMIKDKLCSYIHS